ncbi:prostate and testis expressed protein 13-like [Hipposideros larvatus]
MDPRVFQLLLGISTVLFMDEESLSLELCFKTFPLSLGIRYCNKCDHYNGYTCMKTMKTCWKINAVRGNRSCRTDHFYFSDRLTGRYLFRHTKLSCEACEEGMFQEFHDLLRETFCCTHSNRCNDPDKLIDTVKKYVSPDRNRD